MCNRWENCIHYGTQFELRDLREESRFEYPPLYLRMRRHFHGRRNWHRHGW